MATSKEKLDAIYELRAAAEEKAVAEMALAESPSAEKRMDLLDAKLKLEDKTMTAIEACHECGHEHPAGTPHR
jgi:hypothetical protein